MKMLRRNIIVIGSVLFIFIIVLIYLRTSSDVYDRYNTETVKIFFADNISSAHQELIYRFNQENSEEIEVIPIHLPFSKFSTNERKELLARTLRSKSNRIDVFAVDVIWVPRFARWCEPLDSYFYDDKIDQIIPKALKSCYFNNRLYALPFYIDVSMMYYRRDLIRKLPDADLIEKKLKASMTWQEFIRLSERFNKPNSLFYLFAADSFEGLMCSFLEGIQSLNGKIFKGDSIRFDTPAARRSLQLLVDLVHQDKISPLIITKFDEYQCYLYALKHDGVFFRGWPGYLVHHKPSASERNKFDSLEIAALPHFGEGRKAFIIGGWNLMISKYSTKKEAAAKFLKFLLEERNQKILYEIGGYLPVLKEIYADSSFVKRKKYLQLYARLLAKGVHRPYFVNYTKISDILSYYLNLAIKGEMSVDGALKKATEDVNTNQMLIK